MSTTSPAPEHDLVVVQAELELVAGVADPLQLAERAGRDDRLELGPGDLERRLLDGEPVGVGRGHHELSRLEAGEDPRQHRPRLVAGGRTLHPRDGLEQRVAVDRVQLRGVDVGQPREVVDAVGVEAVARRAAVDPHDPLLGAVLDVDLRRRAGAARDRRAAGPGTTVAPAASTSAASDERSDSSMSVAAR